MRAFAASMLIATAAPALCQTDDQDLAVALHDQIKPCLSKRIRTGKPYKATVEIKLNLDGSIAQLPQLSANPEAAAGDPDARAVADAALDAIWACAPYKLPPNRYEQWRDVVLTLESSGAVE